MKDEIRLLTNEIDCRTNKLINLNFDKVISDIDKSPGSYHKKFWQITRFLKNRPKRIPALTIGDKKIITDQEKCDAFANQFRKVHEETDTKLDRNVTSKKVKVSLTQIDPRSLPFITILKVLTIISSLKIGKALGLDNVNNKHLKELPLCAAEYLRNIFIMLTNWTFSKTMENKHNSLSMQTWKSGNLCRQLPSH